jgi:hypothetical protein
MLMVHRRTLIRTVVASPLAALLAVGCAVGQELEPRAYSPSPVGTTFIVVSGTRSSGGVFTDASAPIDDVESTVSVLGVAIGQTFAIAGKQALVMGALPMTWGTASGQIGEARRSTSRTGLADPRIRVSLILAGSPALRRAEFARAPRRTILGSSLIVVPPIGQYDRAKLVNLGSHRWAFKPEMGVSAPFGRWTADAYGGVWLFTTNEAYYPGSSTRKQSDRLGARSRELHARSTFVAGVQCDVVFGRTNDRQWRRQGQSPAKHAPRRDVGPTGRHPSIAEGFLQYGRGYPDRRRLPHDHRGLAVRDFLRLETQGWETADLKVRPTRPRCRPGL